MRRSTEQTVGKQDHTGRGRGRTMPGRWRRGRSTPTADSRLEGRRRGLLAAALVLLVCGIAAAGTASSPAGHDAAAVVAAAAEQDRSAGGLSAGAPAAAMTLSGTPVHVPEQQPATATVISGLAANGIPGVALNAYRVAATRMDGNSSCGIDWSLLAGIGRVESNHGRFGGATLNPDGTSSPKIVGPALNGVAFAFVHDTDGGKIDGDSSYDRAVGPMQFIPSTWHSYAVDGNGDGVADPSNINDAALAAAHYLCVAGGDLRTADGQRRAVLAYNHSDSYVAQVLALAQAYASGIAVADLPLVGDTAGPIPAPTGDYTAPASPGDAIGARDTTTSPDAITPAAAGTAPQGGAQAQPAAQGNPPAPSAGQPSTGTQSGTRSGTGTGTKTGTGSPSQPAPAPAPEPATSGTGSLLPSLPLPTTAPAVPTPSLPAPTPVAPALPLCSTLPLLKQIPVAPGVLDPTCRTS